MPLAAGISRTAPPGNGRWSLARPLPYNPAEQVTLAAGPGNVIVKAACVKCPSSEAADSARQSRSPTANTLARSWLTSSVMADVARLNGG